MNSAEMILPHLKEFAFICGFFGGAVITLLSILVIRQR